MPAISQIKAARHRSFDLAFSFFNDDQVENRNTPETGKTPVDYALTYLSAGLSVIPIKTDGTKKPIGKWKSYQYAPMSAATARNSWRNNPDAGISAVCGKVSGNLEVIDCDRPAQVAAFERRVHELAPGLIEKLTINRTPRDGRHYIYRCPIIQGNQKLAHYFRPATEQELEDNEVHKYDHDGVLCVRVVSFETRGEGGYIIMPGTPAHCHPLNKTYDCIQGDYENPAEITPEERDILLRVAREFDETPVVERSQSPAPQANASKSQPVNTSSVPGERPGDLFNASAEAYDRVRKLLADSGATFEHDGGGLVQVARPGKTLREGTGATLYPSGAFKVFSTNWHPFTIDTPYSPFGIYALLAHNGDFSAAGKALFKEGYGKPKAQEKTTPRNRQNDARGLDRMKRDIARAAGIPSAEANIAIAYGSLCKAKSDDDLFAPVKLFNAEIGRRLGSKSDSDAAIIKRAKDGWKALSAAQEACGLALIQKIRSGGRERNQYIDWLTPLADEAREAAHANMDAMEAQGMAKWQVYDHFIKQAVNKLPIIERSPKAVALATESAERGDGERLVIPTPEKGFNLDDYKRQQLERLKASVEKVTESIVERGTAEEGELYGQTEAAAFIRKHIEELQKKLASFEKVEIAAARRNADRMRLREAQRLADDAAEDVTENDAQAEGYELSTPIIDEKFFQGGEGAQSVPFAQTDAVKGYDSYPLPAAKPMEKNDLKTQQVETAQTDAYPLASEISDELLERVACEVQDIADDAERAKAEREALQRAFEQWREQQPKAQRIPAQPARALSAVATL